MNDNLIKKIDTLESMGLDISKSNRVDAVDGLDVGDLDPSFPQDVVSYFDHVGWRKVDPWFHVRMAIATGNQSTYYIPSGQFRSDVIRCFNDKPMRKAYTDKNIYDLIVKTDSKPRNIIRSVRGRLFSLDGRQRPWLDLIEQLSPGCDYIIKPSITDNGVGVSRCRKIGNQLEVGGEMLDLNGLFSRFSQDFLVQEKIEQHESLAKIHPDSVNTIRAVTFRWDGEIHFLLAFLRVGNSGFVNDNAGTGGFCVGLDDQGRLKSYAVDKHWGVIQQHPMTGYDFRDPLVVPGFSGVKQFAVDLHKDILHHDLVSWDIAIDKYANPVFVEHNFKGAFWLYQLATEQPLFGSLSADVIPHVASEFRRRRARAREERKQSSRQGEKSAVHIVITGDVQGVNYRKWLKRKAIQRGVTGWVRNSPDGGVEARLFGGRPTVMGLVGDCSRGPKRARVKSVRYSPLEYRPRKGFKIKKTKREARSEPSLSIMRKMWRAFLRIR